MRLARPQSGLGLLLIGNGAVERLLTDVALLVQRPRAFEIAAGPHHFGARLRHLPGGGVHGRLERRTFEREHKSALLYVLAFLEDAAHQESLDTGAQFDRIDGDRLTHVLGLGVDVSPLHRRHDDGRRRRLRLGARLLVAAGGKRQRGRQQARANTTGDRCDANHYLSDRRITSGMQTSQCWSCAEDVRTRRTSSAGRAPPM